MSSTISAASKPSALPFILLISLSFMTGCAHKQAQAYAPTPIEGSNCYAKAIPTVGEGGLAWGASLQQASQSSMVNCKRYAGRSGGTPQTCRVVDARCKH